MARLRADVDGQKLEELQGKVMGDVAGSMGLIMAYLGDRLDLYSALAELGEGTSQQLAESTGVNERYVREWLCSNAAAGYVNYSPDGAKFSRSRGTHVEASKYFSTLQRQIPIADIRVDPRDGTGTVAEMLWLMRIAEKSQKRHPREVTHGDLNTQGIHTGFVVSIESIGRKR